MGTRRGSDDFKKSVITSPIEVKTIMSVDMNMSFNIWEENNGHLSTQSSWKKSDIKETNCFMTNHINVTVV